MQNVRKLFTRSLPLFILHLIVFHFAFILPVQAAWLENGSADFLKKPTLQVNIPTVKFSDAVVGDKTFSANWIGEYIAGIYTYGIGIVGIVAAVVLMAAGAMWLMAGGNTGRVQEAQEWIKAAITGLILALTSFAVLYAINPSLTTFNPLTITGIARQPLAYAPNSRVVSVASGTAYIKENEGLRLTAYPDLLEAGKWIIGYGHLLTPQELATFPRDANGNITITQERAEALFALDYAAATSQAQNLAGRHGVTFTDLSAAQQAALIDMAFNMGEARLAGFQDMWTAIGQGDWDKAAAEILDSNYATQLPARADRNADLMRNTESTNMPTPGATYVATEARAALNNRISSTPGVNFAGIRQTTVSGLNALQNQFSDPLIITSATDGQHQQSAYSHAQGYKVDLRLTDELTSFIQSKDPVAGTVYDKSTGVTYTEHVFTENGYTYRFLKESDHWDLRIVPVR